MGNMKYLVTILIGIIVIVTCQAQKGSSLTSPSAGLRLSHNHYRFHRSKITLSGFSSGGTFAQMLQFSYSSLFHGIAVFSHNFYRCGPPTGVVDDYDRVCTKLFNLTDDQHYNPELVHRDIAQYLRAGQIENVANLQNKKLYVYAGLSSFLFTLEQSMGILKVYERYIKNPKAIRTRIQDANLVLPTNNNLGVPCTAAANTNSFIGNCGFSGAHEALSFLLNDNHPHIGNGRTDLIEPQPGQQIKLEPLRTFDQSEFNQGVPNHNMDSLGLIYIPSSGCINDKCYLHFYFHGCFVGRELNGTKHIVNSGYLELAELNQIIMVFPQALSSSPNNVIGCWDTFGLGGPLYATNQGPQVRVVKKILDAFLLKPESSNLSGRPSTIERPKPGGGGGSGFFGNGQRPNSNGNGFGFGNSWNNNGKYPSSGGGGGSFASSSASSSSSSSHNNNGKGPVRFPG